MCRDARLRSGCRPSSLEHSPAIGYRLTRSLADFAKLVEVSFVGALGIDAADHDGAALRQPLRHGSAETAAAARYDTNLSALSGIQCPFQLDAREFRKKTAQDGA